jgi:hypothetical protein
MDSTILDLLKDGSTSIAAVLALVIFFYARKDALRHKTEWRDMAERYEGKEALLLDIVKDNTAAIVANTQTATTVLEATKELRVEVTELRKANGRRR